MRRAVVLAETLYVLTALRRKNQRDALRCNKKLSCCDLSLGTALSVIVRLATCYTAAFSI